MRQHSISTTPGPLSLSGTFGNIQLGANDRAVVIQTTGRNYDTLGHLHISSAHVRLPINDAIRLHALLADAIVAADEQPDTRQTALWSDTTLQVTARRIAA